MFTWKIAVCVCAEYELNATTVTHINSAVSFTKLWGAI